MRLYPRSRMFKMKAPAFALILGVLLLGYLLRQSREPAPIVAADLAEMQDELPIEPESEAPQPDPIDWRTGDFSKTPFYNKVLELGLNPTQVHQLIDVLTPFYDFRKAHPNHRWRLGFEQGEARFFSLEVSPVEIYDVTDLNTTPQATRRDIETVVDYQVVRGEIRDSLCRSLDQVAEGPQLALKLASVYAWDIDFYQDPRVGDRFEILVERIFIRRQERLVFHEYGSILAARYIGQRGEYEAFQFTPESGDTGYFNEKGESLIRDVLRSPLKYQGITSSFRKGRFHPILKKYRNHNGVDYVANKNTPVRAVADGQVVTSGRHGGAGIAVEIKHRNQMLTQYFHLNKIAAGVRRGNRVRQGQIIGYVGKTGYATGYHLHFGMKIRNKYVNPLSQKFSPGEPIPKSQMPGFELAAADLRSQLAPPLFATEIIPLVRVPDVFERVLASPRSL